MFGQVVLFPQIVRAWEVVYFLVNKHFSQLVFSDVKVVSFEVELACIFILFALNLNSAELLGNMPYYLVLRP